jgi:hypothetical protein
MHPQTYIIKRSHEFLLTPSQILCVYQTKEMHRTELRKPSSESLPASQAHLHTILLIPTNFQHCVCSLPHSLVTLELNPTSTTPCLILKMFCFQDAKFSFPASLIHWLYLSVSLRHTTHTHTHWGFVTFFTFLWVTRDYKKCCGCHRTNGSNSSQITRLER